MMSLRKIELAKLYSETAEKYRRRYREIQREKYELVLSILPSKIGRILDVGCGTGELLLRVARKADLAIGMDISPGMVKRIPHAVKNVYVVIADADFLPFKDNSFDCVVSVTLLQNMPDPETTVKEICRVVRSGGLVILTSLKKKHKEEMLVSWAKSAGFSVEKSGEIGEDVYCVCLKK
ncbi:MAG: class I SAM-dependent methyltransferase [Candidatus Hadarchaeales archaeon]